MICKYQEIIWKCNLTSAVVFIEEAVSFILRPKRYNCAQLELYGIKKSLRSHSFAKITFIMGYFIKWCCCLLVVIRTDNVKRKPEYLVIHVLEHDKAVLLQKFNPHFILQQPLRTSLDLDRWLISVDALVVVVRAKWEDKPINVRFEIFYQLEWLSVRYDIFGRNKPQYFFDWVKWNPMFFVIWISSTPSILVGNLLIFCYLWKLLYIRKLEVIKVNLNPYSERECLRE